MGLRDVGTTHRYDPFLGTTKEKVARKFGVRGANVLGRKPER